MSPTKHPGLLLAFIYFTTGILSTNNTTVVLCCLGCVYFSVPRHSLYMTTQTCPPPTVTTRRPSLPINKNKSHGAVISVREAVSTHSQARKPGNQCCWQHAWLLKVIALY